MMDPDILCQPQAPYLYVIGATVSEVTDFAWALAERGSPQLIVRFLRGHRMTTVNTLFDEFAAALQFPYYFGENWDALDECITDLEWLPGDSYALVITNAVQLLSKEDGRHLQVLVNILERAGDEWGQPVETTEAWSRPAVAFHVLLQSGEADKSELITRLESVSASFKEVRLPALTPTRTTTDPATN